MSILKHNRFLWSISPRVDVLLFQEHKLRGAKLEHLNKINALEHWIDLEAELRYKSWLNHGGAGKGRVSILLASKYARLFTSSRSIMNNKVI